MGTRKIKIPGDTPQEQAEYVAQLRDPFRRRRSLEAGSYLSRDLTGAAGPADAAWNDTHVYQRMSLVRPPAEA